MSENSEDKKGFKVTDRRLSSQSEEEKEKADAEKAQIKAKDAEEFEKSKEGSPYKLDFSSFVLSLCTSALVQLGEVPDPVTKKNAENLQAAKQTIDLLGILKEKTEGNLSSQEKAILDNYLYDLRLKFVNKNK